MSDPGFIRSDLCSIGAAAEQAEFAEQPVACSAPMATRWPATRRYAFAHLRPGTRHRRSRPS